MSAQKLVCALLILVSVHAWGFDAYFSDAAGVRLGEIREGRRAYIVVRDPEKGSCSIDEFRAHLVIFDFKTGAHLDVRDAVFRELGGIGSGLYFWVERPASNAKLAVPIGARWDYGTISGQTHWMGRLPAPFAWAGGGWSYVDENVLRGDPLGPFVGAITEFGAYPRDRRTARVSFEGLPATPRVVGGVLPATIRGRFENNDTLVLIVADQTDERNIDPDQLKIVDTPATLAVQPSTVRYGCPECTNIVVRIEDADENLNDSEVEYVPFFVIVNPGGWTPDSGGFDMIHNFCELLWRGGVDADGSPLDQPIRWYNIYDTPVLVGGVWSRWIDYPDSWLSEGNVGRVLFFASETSPSSGVFEYNFGNLEQFQAKLGFRRFPPGTTIAFHYIDPNDFDDVDVAVIHVGDRPRSQVFITDSTGNPVSSVDLASSGLYIKVLDPNASVQACCPDTVLVAICNPHNEGDCEYVILDEIGSRSGVFFTQSAVPLVPVWDAVGGYQRVFDDWRVQAYNEDTLLVWYASVGYLRVDINALGDGNARR